MTTPTPRAKRGSANATMGSRSMALTWPAVSIVITHCTCTKKSRFLAMVSYSNITNKWYFSWVHKLCNIFQCSSCDLVSFSLSLSLCLFVCPSVCLCLCLSVCLFFLLFVLCCFSSITLCILRFKKIIIPALGSIGEYRTVISHCKV